MEIWNFRAFEFLQKYEDIFDDFTIFQFKKWTYFLSNKKSKVKNIFELNSNKLNEN